MIGREVEKLSDLRYIIRFIHLNLNCIHRMFQKYIFLNQFLKSYKVYSIYKLDTLETLEYILKFNSTQRMVSLSFNSYKIVHSCVLFKFNFVDWLWWLIIVCSHNFSDAYTFNFAEIPSKIVPVLSKISSSNFKDPCLTHLSWLPDPS